MQLTQYFLTGRQPVNFKFYYTVNKVDSQLFRQTAVEFIMYSSRFHRKGLNLLLPHDGQFLFLETIVFRKRHNLMIHFDVRHCHAIFDRKQTFHCHAVDMIKSTKAHICELAATIKEQAELRDRQYSQ